MTATQTGLFSTDPGKIVDFSGRRAADIFNESVLPTVNSFLDLLGPDPGGLEEASQRRSEELSRRTEEEMFSRKQDDDFLASLSLPPETPVDLGEYATGDVNEYNQANTPPASQRESSSKEPQGAAAPALSKPTKNVVDFIKHFEAGGAKEGFYPEAYWDYGQWSIGYGTRAKKGERIDRDEAERRLASELSKHRARVENLNTKYGYNFSENELDALTSFDYNTGSLEKLTENGKRDKNTIARKILEYNKAGGKTLSGLVTRRKAEHNLFTQGY